jgi:hypothetical protein
MQGDKKEMKPAERATNMEMLSSAGFPLKPSEIPKNLKA